MASVALEKVTKVFDGSVVAVNDVSIDVKDGEFMVIVGPSGCGKTTILRLIAGLEEPQKGRIKIAGNVVNDVSPRDRDVAMVFQNYALYPHMTVFQNMAFALRLRNVPKDRITQAVEDAAKALGIERMLNRKPKALSGGQRQRVALGRAIVRNPKVFLFDEPLSNLDPNLRITTRAELKALHQRLETTCIYVTHDQAEAMTLGRRICVIDRGIVRQIAAPMEVYDRPANRFVAGFLGTPAMNFLAGRIELTQGHAYFVGDDASILLPDRMIDKLTPHNTEPVTLGIRPENLSLRQNATGGDNVLVAKVRLVEPRGDRTEIVTETPAAAQLTINADPHTKLAPADTVRIYLDTAKAHLFPRTNGEKNITLQ
ncbi:MAG: ABC transporter ATP-binding protein [Sedimentisphaerales bacterium]|nr:ABC transporter ATP-binding protein [Sedimentisphaerales bacterium]